MVADPSEILPQPSWGRGTVRRTVEGRALARVSVDEGQHSFDVAQNFRRRNPNGHHIMHGKPGIAPRVFARPLASVMRFAVHLDAQLRGVAIEVEIIGAGGMLLAPFVTPYSSSELLPKQHFRQAHLAAEGVRATIGLAGAFEHVLISLSRFARPSTMLRMVPLPQQAGGGFREDLR